MKPTVHEYQKNRLLRSGKNMALLLLLCSGMAKAQTVTIPDANFKAKLLAADVSNSIASDIGGNPMKIDANGNGDIEVSEAAGVYMLNVSASSIADLTGISSFTNMDILFCQNNQLTSLDVSALTSMRGLTADHNQLSSINVSGLSSLEILECSYNQFTVFALNGLGLSSIRGVGISNNLLTSINISGLSALENLNCSNNQLTALSFSGLANLQVIDCSFNQLTSLTMASLLNLDTVYCHDNLLTSLVLTGAMTNFHKLYCGRNNLVTLNLTAVSNLIEIDCSENDLTAINTSGLTDLANFYCNNNQLTTLNVTGLISLKWLNCNNNQLTSLTVMGITSLESLNCSYNSLATLDLSGLSGLKGLVCSYNSLPSLNVSNLTSLENFACDNNQLPALSLTGLINLKRVFCQQNQLPSLDLNGLPNLLTLWCDNNQITSLDLNGTPNLDQLQCSNNLLAALDLSPVPSLTYLYCPDNQITALDVTGLSNIQVLWCDNNLIPALDVTGKTSLTSLHCEGNSIPVLNVAGLVNLEYLFCRNNQISALDLAGLVNLRQLDCAQNQLTTLDARDCTGLNLGIDCSGNQLETLFVKNGLNEGVGLSNNPGLMYVCADESQVGDLQISAEANNPATVVSSYCSFVPGGDYNSITGTVRFDEDNNGCDAADVTGYNVRFDVTGPVASGTFANLPGEYTLFTETGNYTLNAHLENPAYFNMAPTTATFNFPALDNSVQTQDFCLTANGAHPDLEIVLVPFGIARPGFDALYQIIYKNKGNQTLSGTVNLTFDDTVTDFVSATPAADSQAPNTLIWNFATLQPFETRAILFTLNVNSPLETPAVEDGDILDFTASIDSVAGDDTPDDNVSALSQTVVNSFDPNIKTCLEGAVVSPQEIGNYLHYNIEFENLGTAEAVNVVVKDVIDTAKFDISTLQVLYSSHEMRASIRGNIVEFTFQNINLAAAEGNPPVGGHGNVLFKIKTLPSLNAGDVAENKADIFFDYNTPIETNTARTAFLTLSIPGAAIDPGIVVYPNPAKNSIRINCNSSIQTIELFDIQGRMLRSSIVNSNVASLDISDKTTGVYFLRITTDKGQKVEKIIKE